MPTTLATLSKNWLQLSQDYRPSAFWFWNSDMKVERMREVVSEMARSSIREFLIHPVHGMEIEYLSDEFFERYRFALELAKEHDLKVWIYDEFGWPSGVAGGMLLRHHPEHRGWYLDFEKDTNGNVTAKPMQSDRVTDASTGAPWTRSERGYLDTLSVEAVRCFVDMTHERMLKECGKLFDEVIVGFFTDEPVTMIDAVKRREDGTFNLSWGMVGMPWTPVLPARFRREFGYDIDPLYAELAGDGPSQVKRDYWTLVKAMHREAYHEQIGRWCREHGVKYTGHVGEDRPLMQTRFAGSIFQSLSQMDEPGIDFLGYAPEPEDRFAEQVLIPSIARHSGKDRVYCEAFGIASHDIRLGQMLRCAQMFGIHGINDIALMGFHQSLDGVRKHTYWPPIFMEAPWWSFYPQFRDACARSVALASLGSRRSKYAVLYPQNALEQTDLFKSDVWTCDDPGSWMINTLASAIYESGETFEFVFPEILREAKAVDGKIVFPHAQYDAIVAPSDIQFYEESVAALKTLAANGGLVLRESTEDIATALRQTQHSWADLFELMNSGQPGDLRIYRFEYSDGQLFALRNVSDAIVEVTVSSDLRLSEWNPVDGTIISCNGAAKWAMEPHSTRYFSISKISIGDSLVDAETGSIPIDVEWTPTTQRPNLMRLNNIRFHDEQTGWIEAVDSGWFRNGPQTGIPQAFRGKMSIPMQGEFECASIPAQLGILFERAHLESLTVNDQAVDLTHASQLPVWDNSCLWVDIRDLCHTGTNTVNGVLRFQCFEMSLISDAFFVNEPIPTCDICVSGSFRLRGGTIFEDDTPLRLPVRLDESGWREYDGVIELSSNVAVDEKLARRIRGISVDPVQEDCIEVVLDGKSVGRCITRPYVFDLERIEPGVHHIQLIITSTSANTLAIPSPWGVNTVSWIV